MTSEAEIRSTDSSSPPDPEPSDIQQLAAMKKNGKVPVNVIVQQYEKYRKSLKETGLLAFKGEGTSALLDNLKELEELYTSVHKSSSMSVHFSDAQALSDTSNYAAVNAKNLKLGDLGVTLNVKEFNNELAEYLIDDTMEATAKRHSNGEVSEESFNSHNWLKLGLLFHKVSSKPIPMEFLNGPIDTEKKVRTKRRIIDDTKGLKNTTTAQQLEVDELENDELNTAHLVKSVFISFNERQKTNPEPVNFFKFFIDPASFSQSVENLFFTSFLIRDARIKLEVKGDIPVVSMVSREETRKVMKNDDHQFISNHHIASFDYETWQELIETHNITESYLGHRDIEADQFDQNFDDNFSSDDDEDDDDNDDDAARVDDEEDDIEQDLLLANGDLSDISQTAKHNDEDDESQNNQLQGLVSELDEDAEEAIIEPSRKRRRIRN